MGTGWSLVKIGSVQENTFVKNLIMTVTAQKTPNYIEGWIGANDIAQEGTWGWVVGDSDATHVTPFWMGGAGGQKVNSSDFVNWEASNPGAEDCAIMAGNSGNWHDGACGFNARLGICEGPLNGPLPDTFAAFAETEPASTAQCVRYNTADFSWYTTDCNTPMPFVCSPPS
jgi:hypothetical protein